jgi:hypothetical protein
MIVAFTKYRVFPFAIANVLACQNQSRIGFRTLYHESSMIAHPRYAFLNSDMTFGRVYDDL